MSITDANMQIEMQKDMERAGNSRRITTPSVALYVPQTALAGHEVTLEVVVVESNLQLAVRGIKNGLNIIDVSKVKPTDFEIVDMEHKQILKPDTALQWTDINLKYIVVLASTLTVVRLIVDA